jgi:hypothetical protein
MFDIQPSLISAFCSNSLPVTLKYESKLQFC